MSYPGRAKGPKTRPPRAFASRRLFWYHIPTMYAIIQTGGKQYWVVPGEILQVEKLSAKEGEEISIKALWSAASGTEEKAGANPLSAKVTAKVLRHLRGPRVIVFKRRPKKAYEKSAGHRQELTELQIKDIQLS